MPLLPYRFYLITEAVRSYSYSQIWHIAYPILLSTLAQQLIGMTDTAFLGRVGEVELGASALGTIFYVTIFMLGVGFSIGAQIVMGRRNGEGNYGHIGGVFYHGVAFLLLLAVALFGLSRWLSPLILEQLIRSPQVFAAADSYLYWRVYGLFFSFVNAMFRAFFVATTHTRTLTYNSLVMLVSNVFFNYIFIFGHLGLPAMGIAGAAIGSVLAEAVSTLFFLVHLYRRVPFRKYALNVLPKFRLSLLGTMLGVGVWTMAQNFLSLATWFVFFLGVEHLGEEQLAATNVIRNLSALLYMVLMSLGATVSTLASNLMGEGESESVIPVVRKTIKLGTWLLLPLFVLFTAFPREVMGIFTDDPSLVEAALVSLFVMMSTYVFNLPGRICFYAICGTGNTRTALVIEAVVIVAYVVYIYIAIFGMRVSLPWCWFCEVIYTFGVFVLSAAYLRWGNWRHKRI